MGSQKTLDIKNVCECNKCLCTKTLHPQATLINLERPDLGSEAVKFEFYAILLIEECPDRCSCCGRKYYDYDNASMVFLKPGDIFRMTGDNTLPDKGWLLAFDPGLLLSTSLRSHIQDYTFFNYRKEEALHLSRRETESVTCCLWNIETELHHPIDTHTRTILSRHIELLLDYCSRYYERQFITRENTNKELLARFDLMADEYLSSGKIHDGIMPSPGAFSRHLNLSAAYLCDLLRFETGKTFSEYLQLMQIEKARRMLISSDTAPSDIARLLGFSSTQYFCQLFMKITGKSPSDYRSSVS